MHRALLHLAILFSALLTHPPLSAQQPIEEVRALTDEMDASQVREAIQILRDHYIRKEDLDDVTLSRAMLEGLLARLPHGVFLHPAEPDPSAGHTPPIAEILRDEVLYLRPLSLDTAAVAALQTALAEASGKGVHAAVLDLRFVQTPHAFAAAAELLSLFLPKGLPLFQIESGNPPVPALFSSNRDRAWHGITVVIIDRDTLGAAEVIAAKLQNQPHTLLIGERTPGAALRYQPYLLANGMVMEVGVGQVLLANQEDTEPLASIEPTLFFPIPPSMKNDAESARRDHGLDAIVYDQPRPRFNEAALVAGGNPELDALHRRQREGPTPPQILDRLLQRAVDLALATAVFHEPEAALTPVITPESSSD